MDNQQPVILIVDDEPAQRQLFAAYAESLGMSTRQSASAEEMLEFLAGQQPDMILLDVRLGGMTGIEALPKIHELAPAVPVLLITAYADLRQAVAALKNGASDYLSKPIDLDELKVAIEDALSTSFDTSVAGDQAVPPLPAGFVCESPALRRVVETVAIAAPSDVPTLITGASGTGKELIARLLHEWSSRSKQPLVTANCAALPESLAESELFGHVKGAFTGASADRLGLFRSASGGTLFLDEIGELPLHLQPKLLRALETNEVTPVGSDKPVGIDTRFIAATNRDLSDDVRVGRFREDLYYRINVVELSLPSLDQRREDIIPLARHFANEYAGRPVRLSPRATQNLLTHSWSGNVRELRNAIQRACLLCRGDVIMPEHLPVTIGERSTDAALNTDTARLSDVERATILATLDECNGNRTHAARKLGISRRTLIKKLHEFEGDSA